MRFIPFAFLTLSLIACGSPEAVQNKDSVEAITHEEAGASEEAWSQAESTEADGEVSAQACVKRCSGGLYNGQSCSSNANCGKTCSGGLYGGQACSSDSTCGKTCSTGLYAGQACSSNASCGKTCYGGSAAGQACSSDSNCPSGLCTSHVCASHLCVTHVCATYC